MGKTRWLAALLMTAPLPARAYVSAWVSPFDKFSGEGWACFDEINPFAYAFDSSNEVFAAYPDLLKQAVQAKPKRVPLIPVVVNDVWDSGGRDVGTLKSAPLLSYWLSDPARLERHARALVETAAPYDGIELDYEHVPKDLWPQYADLVEKVAQALHAQGKKLGVDLEPGPLYSDGGRIAGVYWRRMAAAADKLKIMCYYERGDFSDRTGPGTSSAWVEQTAQRALAILPPDRTSLAFSLAATDWEVPLSVLQSRRHVARLHFRKARALQQETGARSVWDDAFGSPYFKYEKDGKQHEVWYEDERTLGRKLDIARKLGLGASFWYIGSVRPDLKAMGLCGGGHSASDSQAAQ